ncbi:glycosyltransferase family 4 protein [bacterium]|nr:glycosyltransferase family 4 protein [bacterium]
MRGQKVLMVANTTWYLYNFRLPLARYLRDLGYEVVFVSPKDAYVERVNAESFRWIDLGLDRRSLNPLKELGALLRFWNIYRSEKPDVCHHFTIKCVIYGTLAAKFAGVRAVVNAITGLGHAFLGQGILHKLLRPVLRFVYRKILTARRVQVIFQNGDDYREFEDRKMVVPEKVTIIRGSGVNLHRFAPRPGSPDDPPSPTVLLASRLIKEKGVVEYVEAARQLRAEGMDVRFCLAGTVDTGNPSAISQEMLDQWCEEGVIDYLGHIDRIEDVIHLATLVVLPSYREGTPRILLEAAAIGKPIVATDVPGCREVVKQGVNGLLVPAANADALAAAMRTVLTNPDLLQKFGLNSREIAQDFCESKVITQTAEVYLKAQQKAGSVRH